MAESISDSRAKAMGRASRAIARLDGIAEIEEPVYQLRGSSTTWRRTATARGGMRSWLWRKC